MGQVQTLEELHALVRDAMMVEVPPLISYSLGVHNLDRELVIEYADAHSELVGRKASLPGGELTVRLSAAGQNDVVLFSKPLHLVTEW